MGHLISVQNLLLLVGGPDALHFGRDGIRASDPNNPIPLVLEPVSADGLAKFVVAEMPAEIADPMLRQRVDELIEIAEDGHAHQPHRVGALYAKLFWLFQAGRHADSAVRSPQSSSSLGLKPGWHLDPQDFTDAAVIAEFEATRDRWVKGSVTAFILTSAPNAAAARDLITAISDQGEGLGEAHDSHFHEFLELLELLEAGQLQPTALPLNPVARLAPAPDAGTSTPISRPTPSCGPSCRTSATTLLLLDLWHALSTPAASATRMPLIGLAYANMDFVRELTEQLLDIETCLAPPTRRRRSACCTRIFRRPSRCDGSVTTGCSPRKTRSSRRFATVPSFRIAPAANARSSTSMATSGLATSRRAMPSAAR